MRMTNPERRSRLSTDELIRLARDTRYRLEAASQDLTKISEELRLRLQEKSHE